MANPLTSLLSVLSPPVPIGSLPYDGPEYRWKMFVFRPGEFKYEVYMILMVLSYLGLYYVGKVRNARYVNAWFDAHLPLFSQQFSKPTVDGLVQDGNSDFFNYSTGRRHIASLHTTFTLVPRHDPLQLLLIFFRSLIELDYSSRDELELDFSLFPSVNMPGFVWAVVAKDELSKAKEGRWDLTFTRTSENPVLGQSFGVMTEFADITETLLKVTGNTAFVKALSDPAVRPYFRSVSITDQPRTRPTIPIPASGKSRHMILSLRLPPPSQVGATVQLIQSLFALVDTADGKINLRPETRTKLKKVREELDQTLIKEAVAEQKEEAESEKHAAKRKAEGERISKLSATEQRKILDRERKRSMRKSQGKVVKK